VVISTIYEAATIIAIIVTAAICLFEHAEVKIAG
jgi:hypothetical protein